MNLRAIGPAALLLGMLFKSLHWPGAVMVLAAGAILTLVSFAVLLALKRGPWTLPMRVLGLLLGALTCVFVGVFFKSMHWPGANFLIVLGMLGGALWALIGTARSELS